MNRIFILEDDKTMQFLYTKMLKDYEVTIVNSVSEAFAITEKNRNFDLYIIDVFIKNNKNNGLDFAATIRNKPVIICTAFNLDFVTENLESFKDYTYIQKPINPSEFIKTIEEL
jgi:CheY-like chemotaxis protein